MQEWEFGTGRAGESCKKKKDFTCHLHSWRAGLTAVLFNSSDVLNVKLDKPLDGTNGTEGVTQSQGRWGTFDYTGLTGKILFTSVNQFLSRACSYKLSNSFLFPWWLHTSLHLLLVIFFFYVFLWWLLTEAQRTRFFALCVCRRTGQEW